MSIVMLAYDRVRLLDVTGPLEVFATSGIPVVSVLARTGVTW